MNTGNKDGWNLPNLVKLGAIAHDKEARFELRVVVGRACSVASGVEGVGVSPERLEPGERRVTLSIAPESIRKETLLYGPVVFACGEREMKVMITGNIVEGEPGREPSGGVVWEAAGWGKAASEVRLDEPEGPEVELQRAKAQAGDEGAQGWLLERGFAW